MTLFLASITTPAEARVVLEQGADLIDCAELPAEAVGEIASSVGADDRAMNLAPLVARGETGERSQ